AFLAMILPGTAVVFALGVLYGAHGEKPAVNAVLDGVDAAAVGLLLAVTVQIGQREIGGGGGGPLRLLTCAARSRLPLSPRAVSLFHLSLVLVLLTLGPLAVCLYRPRPGGPPRQA